MRFILTDYIFRIIEPYLFNGAICIDATMGNGNDTLFLSNHIKEKGHVYAFDIQELAIRNTSKLLKEKGTYANYSLFLDNHINLKSYFEFSSIDFIIFNLGYLPKGDKSIKTMPQTSLQAIKDSLDLLKSGGLLVITIYPNQIAKSGELVNEEKAVIIDYLVNLDPSHYAVLQHTISNSKKLTPIPIMVFKL